GGGAVGGGCGGGGGGGRVGGVGAGGGRWLVLPTRLYKDLPRVKGRPYVQPSRRIRAKQFDLRDPAGIRDAYELGLKDGAAFVAHSRMDAREAGGNPGPDSRIPLRSMRVTPPLPPQSHTPVSPAAAIRRARRA